MNRQITFRAFGLSGVSKGKMMPFETFRHWKDWPDNPAIALMQFTGLTDKNGKDVFEGDILRGGEDETCVLVEWDEERNGWSFNKLFVNETYQGEPTKRSAEIIGSIYENPELLT